MSTAPERARFAASALIYVPQFRSGVVYDFGMEFPIRQYSKGRIDRAGEELVSGQASDETLTVIDNWKACHAYPLQVIKMTLKGRAKLIERNPLIGQRIKRLKSIHKKLSDNPQMKLSQMQDLGGCRAVMSSIGNVDALVAMYRESRQKTPSESDVPRDRPVWTDENDYISNPKDDGYRGYHLIYRYHSKYKDKAAFRGQRIEIQIRSRLQHLWATAVEVAETFTQQALKSKIKEANEAWIRFFVLMSTVFAIRERRPIVPGTTTSKEALIHELRQINESEKILDCLSGWNAGTQIYGAEIGNAVTFVLSLDIKRRRLHVIPFQENETPKAREKYAREERRYGNNPDKNVVLVKVDSVKSLRKAYPNYYVDTTSFLKEVTAFI